MGVAVLDDPLGERRADSVDLVELVDRRGREVDLHAGHRAGRGSARGRPGRRGGRGSGHRHDDLLPVLHPRGEVHEGQVRTAGRPADPVERGRDSCVRAEA